MPNHNAAMDTQFARHLKVLGSMIIVVTMIFNVSLSAVNGQPPTYEVTWLDNVWNPEESMRVRDINDVGVVVGRASGFADNFFHAFMYSHSTGQMQDLNELGATWLDLDTGSQTTGWIAERAKGINENNQIVGTAILPGVYVRAFVLDNPFGDPSGPNPPVFTLLRETELGGHFGSAINDLGVVVGEQLGSQIIVFDPLNTPAYTPVGIPVAAQPQEINNLGVIVTRGEFGEGWVISPSTPGSFEYPVENVDFLPNHHFYGINDSGQISGIRFPITTGPPSQRLDGGAFRFQYPGVPVQDDLLIIDNSNPESFFCDVNEAGDVCFREFGRGWIYLDGESQSFNLDNLISFSSPEEESEWLNFTVQPNGNNDNGQIIIQFAGSRAALLTPIGPGPGISVSPIADLTTTEAGGSDSFSVVLDTQPLDNVTVGISTSDDTEGLIDDPVLGLVVATSLTFTPNDWNVAQTVTVKGVDDFEIDLNVQFTIITTADSTTTDPDYNGLDPANVSVTNLDDEQAPALTYNSTGGENNVPIPDQSTAISSILVTDSFTITDLNVTLKIDHARVQDLDVFLISEDGTRIELFTDVGGNGQDFTNTTLDDEAATSITAGSAPFTGSFRPEGILGGFEGKSTSGLWTLEVTDDKRKKTGTILNWSFTVEY